LLSETACDVTQISWAVIIIGPNDEPVPSPCDNPLAADVTDTIGQAVHVGCLVYRTFRRDLIDEGVY